MNEQWKDAVKQVPDDILNELHKVACEQSTCTNTADDCGKCAYCADLAESIVGHYLILTGKLNV